MRLIDRSNSYDLDHIASGGDAQFRKKIAYQLHVAVVHPIESDGVYVVDYYNTFDHQWFAYRLCKVNQNMAKER